jgi:ferredoxin like protein
MNAIVVNVEDKLFQNRYRVDAGRPHIRIKEADTCTNICVDKSCTYVCPASCYTFEANGTVTLITDGCLECGSCRIVCSEHLNVHWEYPRGGHGILFKFG